MNSNLPSNGYDYLKGIDIHNIRDQLIGLDKKVPLLDGSEVTYINFDNAASTPTFRFIYDKVGEYLQYYSNVHRGSGFKSMLSSWVFSPTTRNESRYGAIH